MIRNAVAGLQWSGDIVTDVVGIRNTVVGCTDPEETRNTIAGCSSLVALTGVAIDQGHCGWLTLVW